jgi:hypothetical protein
MRRAKVEPEGGDAPAPVLEDRPEHPPPTPGRALRPGRDDCGDEGAGICAGESLDRRETAAVLVAAGEEPEQVADRGDAEALEE